MRDLRQGSLVDGDWKDCTPGALGASPVSPLDADACLQIQ
jgi:hypothetical protein